MGEKNQHTAGAGIFGVKGTRLRFAISLEMYATIFQAETYAILLCAIIIMERSKNRRISIVTNSQTALRALYTN